MGEDNLTLAEGDHSVFPDGVRSLHRRDVALVSGTGRGGSLDSIQLTCKIICLESPHHKQHYISVHWAKGLDSRKLSQGQKIWKPYFGIWQRSYCRYCQICKINIHKNSQTWLNIFHSVFKNWREPSWIRLIIELHIGWSLFEVRRESLIVKTTIIFYLFLRNPDLRSGGGACLTLGILGKSYFATLFLSLKFYSR